MGFPTPSQQTKGAVSLSLFGLNEEGSALPLRNHPFLSQAPNETAASSLNTPRKRTGSSDQWLELRRANGREKWVNLGLENERARTGRGTGTGGTRDVRAGWMERGGVDGWGGPWRPMERPDSPGGGPGSREAPPPRVRRAGVEPGPRQVVQGVRAAQGAGRSAEQGAAAGWRRRRRQRRAAAGTSCASRLPAAEVARPPQSGDREG